MKASVAQAPYRWPINSRRSRCVEFAPGRDRMADVMRRNAIFTRRMFPLWPVNRFFANLANSGIAVERLLRDAGVQPGRYAPPEAEIESTVLLRLLRRTMRLTRDELWGLRPAPTRLGTFAQACRHAVHAATVGEALRAAFRYYHGLVDDFTLRLTFEGDQARITLVDTLPQRSGRDTLHMVVLQAVRELIEWLSGRTGVIDRVEFQYPPMPDVRPLEAIFGAPFVGGTPRSGLLFASSLLTRVVVAEEREVRSFVVTLPSKLAIMVDDQRSVADRAASYIRAHGDWDMGRNQVAEAFNMSAATFRRRLHEEVGIGFQKLKDRLRCAAAMDLMAIDGVSLEQVAQMLGFAELSSFHRAFKRWTGQGPSTFRCRLHGHTAGQPH